MTDCYSCFHARDRLQFGLKCIDVILKSLVSQRTGPYGLLLIPYFIICNTQLPPNHRLLRPFHMVYELLSGMDHFYLSLLTNRKCFHWFKTEWVKSKGSVSTFFTCYPVWKKCYRLLSCCLSLIPASELWVKCYKDSSQKNFQSSVTLRAL